MSGSTARLQAIEAVTTYKPISEPLNFSEISAGELFGANVFGLSAMKSLLPKPFYKSVLQTVESGSALDPSVADVVATAMKDWAIEKGATHYAGDRNRTSPFAFTGNRFEFRAVGSNQSIAGPMVAINTIVAESLDYIANELEAAVESDPSELHAAVQKVLRDIISEHGSVIFNGDGYSDAWHKEAEERGLPNLRTTVDALPVLSSDEVISLFESYGVLSKRETLSRMEVYLEQYCLTVAVESKTTVEMAKTVVYPAAVRYQGELAATCASLKALGADFDTDTLDKLSGLVTALKDGIAVLEAAMAAEAGETTLAHAEHCCNDILPAMLAVRETADELEGIVADDLWPLAAYQEMLFIK